MQTTHQDCVEHIEPQLLNVSSRFYEKNRCLAMAFFDFLSFSLNRAFLLSGSTFHECWHEKHSSSLAECQNCCRLCTVWRFGVFAFFRSWKIREFYEASLARAASWSRKRLSDKAERSHNFLDMTQELTNLHTSEFNAWIAVVHMKIEFST